MRSDAAQSQGLDVSGKLRIGDHWHAITIIALSQTNPLKAVAEFVENSIDARARHIVIIRGKEKGESFLRIKDDGEGIRRDETGIPDFQHVATHICDSIKRQLKRQGVAGVQGEFGIGLLSFWTVGEELILSSAGADGRLYQMHMRKGDPSFRISQRRVLITEPGTELTIRQILPGIKQLSGEKIQWYLASELRDRIRHSGVSIKVVDRAARAEYRVTPRQFEGRLLHEVSKAGPGPKEIYVEVYLNRHAPDNTVGLYRAGTRVLDNLADIASFDKPPWNGGYLQGMIDAPYLNLTPGSRTGIIYDEAMVRLGRDLEPVETALLQIIEDQQRAEEEQASREVLRSIQRALKEALLALPAEEYDWFNVRADEGRRLLKPGTTAGPAADPLVADQVAPPDQPDSTSPAEAQKDLFEHAGPLFSVKISPASSVVPVEGTKNLRAVARDRTRRLIEAGVSFAWQIIEGDGRLENESGECVTFRASEEPGLVRLKVTGCERELRCEAEALITVTNSLLPTPKSKEKTAQGIPSYTFQKAPGELWRSKYQAEQNLVVINSGHRDFVFAARNKVLKLRYICRLFAKELVVRNFVGVPPDTLLERLIELSLYTEENLK